MAHTKALIIGVTAAAAGVIALWPHAAKTAAPSVTNVAARSNAPAEVKAEAPKVLPVVDLAIGAAIQQNRVQAEIRSNGKDKLALSVRNTGAQPIRLHLPAGQLFSSAQSAVALLRSQDIELGANESKREGLQTVATASSNALSDTACTVSTAAPLSKLAPVFAYVDEHPEVSVAAAQTAVLAVAENLPLTAFAKFAQLNAGSATSKTESKAFKTETRDIISALIVLRDLGMDERLALAIDPQLKIEAMIDPLAHAFALRYYNIADEWGYWKHELLQGDGSTRHYALYGIARFYPDVAVQMLPGWVRETRTNPVYRTSAIQALAETQKPEALTALRQFEQEFGADSELGKAAHAAAGYLDAQFTKSTKMTVAFRTSKALPDAPISAAADNNIAAVN